MTPTLPLPDYPAFLAALKERILSARTSAARAVNSELILLYWDIGRGIMEKQRTAGWGDAVVERLAADLRAGFPDMRGFSADNLWRMRQFFAEYSTPGFLEQAVPEMKKPRRKSLEQVVPESVLPDSANLKPGQNQIWPQAVAKFEGSAAPADFLRQLVAEVPWGHHVELLKKIKAPAARLYYLRATAQLGWSRNVLLNQIKAGAYERAVAEKKTHNFELALPEYLAEQADEMLKSSYNLEFLGIRRAVKERELEDRLTARLQQFILELGYGFCFVGRQYRLALGQKE